jgi:hypothetical protein
MDAMPDFDLNTPQGKQEFQRWVVGIIRNEINSYTRQVLKVGNTGETTAGGKIKIV